MARRTAAKLARAIPPSRIAQRYSNQIFDDWQAKEAKLDKLAAEALTEPETILEMAVRLGQQQRAMLDAQEEQAFYRAINGTFDPASWKSESRVWTWP